MGIGNDNTLPHAGAQALTVDKSAHKRLDAVQSDVERIDRVIRGDGERPGLAEQLRGMQASIESLRTECIHEMKRVQVAVREAAAPPYVWWALTALFCAAAYAVVELAKHYARGSA